MRAARVVTVLVALAAAGLAAFVRLRNPERLDLDAAARQASGGSFVALGDGVTHYDVAGPDSGSRVLLVHGFSVPSYIWDSTVVALTGAGFRVARYDEFGRGFSERPPVRYTGDLFDRQLLQLLDSLGWRAPVHLVGLSMGGAVTATFTVRHPERVRSLTLVDPVAGPRSDAPGMFRIPVVGPALWQALAVPGMAESQLTDFAEPSRWPDWPDRYRVQMRYRGFGRALLSTIREAAGSSLDSLYRAVGSSGVPTLLFWGAEDRTVPFLYADSVRRAIPQAEYHPIERAGHLPHMERADVVNPVLLQFLRAADAAARGDSTGAS
jgi:pimeloyl-ACP methyl ester carboxylesterase